MNIREAQDFSNKVVDVLIKERQKQGLSRYKISKLCGVSEAALSYIENHERHPTLYTLKQIATVLNVNLYELIKEIEENEL
jgi:transcriptional regulator with XRE-family HTH domain